MFGFAEFRQIRALLIDRLIWPVCCVGRSYFNQPIRASPPQLPATPVQSGSSTDMGLMDPLLLDADDSGVYSQSIQKRARCMVDESAMNSVAVPVGALKKKRVDVGVTGKTPLQVKQIPREPAVRSPSTLSAYTHGVVRAKRIRDRGMHAHVTGAFEGTR